MAQLEPTLALQHLLEQFLSTWQAGLRPSLTIKTKYDGSILVHSELALSPWPQSSSNLENIYPFNACGKRSGKGSRSRRKQFRSQTDPRPSNEITFTNTSCQTESEDEDAKIDCHNLHQECEIGLLKLELQNVCKEIENKDCLISKLETRVHELETKLKKPLKTLSMVSVENTNVPSMLSNDQLYLGRT